MKGGLGGNFEDGGIGGGGRNPHRGGGGGGFALDRSKVRILLCDSDAKSSKEVFQLLCNCSYQVTSVRTARQVIDVLGAQGPEIDIILAEVDLPIAKGFKMLKYITRNQELRRIPIIMMSAQDEVSVVVKCLRLGAADYLVKPLRTNELLNLWTHMWRRRRMLGLAEKDILNPDFELVLSDPSDANTNSTTLLSDDTDDKPRAAIQLDLTMSDHREYESNTYAMEPVHNNMLEKEPNILEDGDCTSKQLNSQMQLLLLNELFYSIPTCRYLFSQYYLGKRCSLLFSAGIFSRPKKTNLKVGESSAFLTYVKSSAPTSSDHQIDGNASLSEHLNDEVNLPVGGDIERCNSRGKQDSYAHGSVYGAGENVGRMYSYLTQAEFPVAYLSSSNMQQQQSRADGQAEVSGVHSIFPFPIYFPGIMNQNMIPPSMQMCQGDDTQVHNTPGALPQYNILPHCAHVPVMPTFPYHPVGINMQSGHMPAPHLWPSMTSSSTPETNSGPSGRTQRREAALIKFRQKRKDRCFDKKIRYVNRKKLAERRPRVRGQFVRQVNGVHIHPNDSPAVDADSEEDDDEEHIPRELDCGSSPERDVSDC